MVSPSPRDELCSPVNSQQSATNSSHQTQKKLIFKHFFKITNHIKWTRGASQFTLIALTRMLDDIKSS